jgi:hypothetical protein
MMARLREPLIGEFANELDMRFDRDAVRVLVQSLVRITLIGLWVRVSLLLYSLTPVSRR